MTDSNTDNAANPQPPIPCLSCYQAGNSCCQCGNEENNEDSQKNQDMQLKPSEAFKQANAPQLTIANRRSPAILEDGKHKNGYRLFTLTPYTDIAKEFDNFIEETAREFGLSKTQFLANNPGMKIDIDETNRIISITFQNKDQMFRFLNRLNSKGMIQMPDWLAEENEQYLRDNAKNVVDSAMEKILGPKLNNPQSIATENKSLLAEQLLRSVKSIRRDGM